MSPRSSASALAAEEAEAPEERARQYACQQRRISLVEMAFGAVFLLLLALGKGFNPLDRALPLAIPWRALLVFLAILWVYNAISFPLTWYAGLLLPRRYGLSVQGFGGWLWDEAKGLLLASVLGGASAALVYYLLESHPSTWWLWSAVVVALVAIVLAQLAPVILVPLFFRLRPLGDEALAQRLAQLAERFGTKVRGVYTMELSAKTTAANAALMGLGRTRRIVLGDTMLQSYSPEEIEVVLAHELGHHLHGDIAKGIALDIGLIFASFYLVSLALPSLASAMDLSGIADPVGLPLLGLVFVAFAILLAPLMNAYSRWRERAADDFALRATADPIAFISMMEKLARQNLAEPNPSRAVEVFFYGHPPIAKRIRRAQSYQWREGVSP